MTTAAAIAVQTPTNRLGFILGFPLWSVVYAPCRPGKRTSWAKEGSHAQLPASAAFRVVEVRAGTAECDSWPPCSWLRVPPSLPTPRLKPWGVFWPDRLEIVVTFATDWRGAWVGGHPMRDTHWSTARV